MYDLINIKNNENTLIELQTLNEITNKKNLSLTTKEITELIDYKNITLTELGRIEVTNILSDLIIEFYDSPYIDQENYLNTLEELTKIFYVYQSTFNFKLTDEEVIKYLKENYDKYAGSFEILETTAFDNLKELIESKKLYE